MQHPTSDSVYQQVLQGEWGELHPRLRTYVDVRVRSRLVGEVFRYAGTFTYDHVARGAMDGI